jgi:MFS family permease
VIVRVAPPTAVGWWMAPTLLIAGIGGGWVISPNTTLTLHCVPVAMAGSAGGALQTGQRIGAAIGTAALPGIFYALLAANGRNYPQAAAITLGVAVASILVALVVAVAEWRAGKRRGDSPCGPPEHIPDAA